MPQVDETAAPLVQPVQPIADFGEADVRGEERAHVLVAIGRLNVALNEPVQFGRAGRSVNELRAFSAVLAPALETVAAVRELVAEDPLPIHSCVSATIE